MTIRKELLNKAIAGLALGVFIALTTVLATAFSEPTSGPMGGSPSNAAERGDALAYGRGYSPTASGSGSTPLSKTACDAAAPTWYWFEDGNGDGDQTDGEDGVCIRAVTVNSDSWNGAEQITPNNITASTTATGGSANTIVRTGSGWTADAYKNHIVKISGGTAVGCWGRVKGNTNDTITVYGSWLTAGYTSGCGTPDATSVFKVSDDWGQFDHSFIGDYACSGNFPSGTVTYGQYPSSGVIALATADCYDGKRDLLPDEANDRYVLAGTSTSADATSITDTNQALETNVWIGQKVLIISGTGAGSYGYIESNTATQLTVASWLGGSAPAAGSAFRIIYIVPHASYTPDAQVDGDNDDQKANNGPLTEDILKSWKGTRLPTMNDFIGYCGYKDGGSNYETNCSRLRYIGNYGGQLGRTDECLDLSNSGGWEWLSEKYNYQSARVAGGSACSYSPGYTVNTGNRFRAVFRP